MLIWFLITFLFIGCSLDIAVLPAPGFDDHGSNIETATPVTSGSSIVGIIDTAYDNDYFSIEIDAGMTLRVRTAGPTNTIGAILDSAGEQLKILGGNNEDPEDENFNGSFDVEEDDTYYIRVASEGDVLGGYALFVDVEPTVGSY